MICLDLNQAFIGLCFFTHSGIIVFLKTYLVLLSLWRYKLLSSWIARSVIIALYVSVLYPFLGFYALFAALLFGVYEWGLFRKDKDSKRIVPIAIGVLFIAVVPFLYWIYYYTQLEFGLIYMAGFSICYFNFFRTLGVKILSDRIDGISNQFLSRMPGRIYSP